MGYIYSEFKQTREKQTLLQSIQRYMISPKQDITNENLYEIPSCTICLQELYDEISSLSCGHCFHNICITQHFQYVNSCPNCRKHTHEKEIRNLIYPLQKNSKANHQMRSILATLEKSEAKQVEGLLTEIKRMTEQNQKYRNGHEQFERQIKLKNSAIEHGKDQLNRKKIQIQKLRKENLLYHSQNKQLCEKIKDAEVDYVKLRVDYDNLQRHEKQYQQMKKLKRVMSEHCQQIIDYKNELESKGSPPEEMARLFFDMVMMKNLEVLKLKDRLIQFPQRLNEKDQEITKLKTIVENLRKQIKDCKQKVQNEKSKYDELKNKHRLTIQRMRNRDFKESDIPDLEDSVRIPFKDSSMIIEEPLVQTTLVKKPSTSTMTFGGFNLKKKSIEEKPKTFKNLMY